MKLRFVLPLLLGLLLLSSGVASMDPFLLPSVFRAVKKAELFADSPNSVRLPEHTCQKTIGTVRCKPERCEQECSVEPKGRGECIDDVCSCSFYCPQPPV